MKGRARDVAHYKLMAAEYEGISTPRSVQYGTQPGHSSFKDSFEHIIKSRPSDHAPHTANPPIQGAAQVKCPI
jgi:hypothetical protein